MQQPRMAAAALAPAGWGHGQAGRSAAMGQQPPGAPVSDAQLATLQEQLRQYGSIMHSHSQKMMQQPVPPPDPRYRCEELSLSELKVERERISRSHREAALQLLLADPDPSVQTQIRIKQLQLLPLQHQVRNELRMIFEGSHGPDAIRQWFEGKKRFQTEVERGLKRAARARADEIKRHTKITRGFFDDMFKHGERMRELVKKSRQSARRDRTKAEKWHNDKIRDDKKLEEKRRRERIQALRDNDEEKYLALLKSEKNERLNHLMKETEAHLQLLTEKMQMAAPEGLQSNGEGVDGQPRTAGQRFHQAAHAAKEQITEQPSILVGGDLKSYQIEGLNWTVSLFNNGLNGILADEMGLGKTIQTIALITHLMERKANPGPYLIVVPLSVLPNWRLELEKWAPSVKLVVFKGPDATRKRIFKEEMADFQFNVVLTTYEYIMKGKALLGKFLWQYIIIDEGHRIKNAESKLAVMLGHKYKSKNRLLLTGTPLQNNLSELWALLNFLLPQVFNSSASFEAWFNEPMAKLSATGGSEEESALNEEEKLIIVNRLHAILKPFMLRRMKKDVESQLPQKSEVVLKVELSGWQKLIYRQLKNEGLRSVDSEGRAVNKQMMNLMMQLRKACNHPYLFWGDLNFPNEALYRASGKFEMLDRMLPKLHKTGHKVLIFTQMTKILDLMEEFLTWRHWKYLRLDGTTRSEERGQVVDQFMDKDAGNWIFLLTTRAGGVGLNLQVADTVIIFDSDWNPQMDMQAMDRAHRIGQQSEVRVFRMITNTQIEEEIFSRAKAKKNVNEIVVRETNEDETDRQARLRKLLEEEKQEGSDDEESEESGAMSWDECNNMLARSEEELALFEKMDKELLERDEAEWNARQEDDPKPWPGRLMSDAELPTWMVSGAGSADTADSGTSNAAADSAAVQENLGPRKRERVSYKPVSDQEFNRMLLSESGAGSGAGKKTTKSAKKEVDPQMKKQLLGIWTVVANTSQTGLFDKLPTKRELPDYYQIIAQPISLKEIKRKVNNGELNTVESAKENFDLMFANARQYNMPGSEIVQDVDAMEAAMMQHLVTLGGKQSKKKRSQQMPPAMDSLAESWNQPPADAVHGRDAMSQYSDGAAEVFNDIEPGESSHSYGNDMADDYSNPYATGEESSRSNLVLKRKHDSSESGGVDSNGRPRLTLSRPGAGDF